MRSFDTGIVGFGIDFEFVWCRLCAGRWRRRRWCWRRGWHCRRQRRWTRRHRHGDAECKRRYRLTVRRVRFWHDGNNIGGLAKANDEGRDGFACVGQRNEEGLLTAVLGLGCP
jgi:hypothetical protein